MNILGVEEHQLRRDIYRYLCGYCTCEEKKGFYIATTFLTPGMKGTPEHVAWEGNRQDLFRRASALTYRDLVDHKDFSLLSEFHHQLGIEQIRVEPKRQRALCN